MSRKDTRDTKQTTMKKLELLLLVFASAFLLSACGGDNSPSSEPSPAPSPTPATPSIDIATTENTSPVLSQTGGSAQLTFKTNADWTAKSSDSWIKVSQTSGKAGTITLTISAEDNDGYDDRKGTVTISSGSVSKTIDVSQVQKDAIVLALQDYSVAATAQTLDFEVETNVSLSVAISDDASSWITQATTRALHTESLHFDIAPNPTKETREGIITISGGSVSQNIKVKQDGDGIITFEDAEVKRICVENWYTNKDGELSFSEAAAVTIIDTTFSNNKIIKSFNELQYFKNIQISPYFTSCSNLEKITIPEGVTSIGNYVFAGCNSLTSVGMPESLISIGERAFKECNNLNNITIPEGVTDIGDCAFDGCSSLSSITIPEGVTTINQSTFNMCKSLASITIPEGVTTIGDSAFGSCYSLTNIILPESLTHIGVYAFAVSGLNSISIPKGVTSIDYAAFKGCI